MSKILNIRFLLVFTLALSFLAAPVASHVLSEQVYSEVANEQSSEDGSESDETFVSELSLDVIIPSHAFEFDSGVKLLQPTSYSFQLLEEILLPQYIQGYAFTYFEKIFEHTIAVNAP